MDGYINLKKLSLAELAGIVNIYPWFASARKELFFRMSSEGSWSGNRWNEVSMYLPDTSTLSRAIRPEGCKDCSDTDIQELLGRCTAQAEEQKNSPRVIVVGGDYFTQAEYDKVRRNDDNVFAGAAWTSRPESQESRESSQVDFCTETLAGIYADQGYFEQARDIYSKLILAYPEKSAYFATLIEKLNQSIL